MKIIFGQDLAYIKRWCFISKLFSIRLHHWRSSDDLRNPHDHAWDFISIIFRGSYEDVSPSGNKIMKAPCIHFKKAEHRHSVKILSKDCWSLLLTGRDRRQWGFWVDGRFRKRNKYFFEWGHHQNEL